MASLGLLPSPVHHTTVSVSASCKLTRPPSKFKFESGTAQNTVLGDNTLHNQRNPQTQLLTVRENATTFDSLSSLTKGEIIKYPPLSNRINGHASICICDCRQVHARLLKLGAIETDAYVVNKLVVAYSRNRESLDDARKLFDEIPERRIPAYAALIGSYCRLENWIDLFSVLGLMVNDAKLPDKYLIPTILKACSALQVVETGKMVHGFVIKKDLGKDIFVGNSLIDMYANFGYLSYSRNVFDTMGERDVVSWTALVAAYMDGGLLADAMDTFRLMQLDGVKADLIAWNSFVSGFARSGDIEFALQSLEQMQENGLRPNVNTWNGIISGFVHNEHYEEALYVFFRMLRTPENPNIVTVVSILPACSHLKDLTLGQLVHGYAIKLEFCSSIRVQGSLIDMYSKCGRSDLAEIVFVRTRNKNTAVWNEMIGAYVNEGKFEAAMGLLQSMKDSGINPDEITYNTILAAHAKDGKKMEAYELLNEVAQMGLQPNTVTFNILISGFQRSGLSHEALKLFQLMQSPCSGDFPEVIKRMIRPNPVTITSALAACADLGLRQKGKEVHGYIVKNCLKSNIFVSSTLVDMYAKCCGMDSAIKVFWQIENKNTVCWNNLMLGHINNAQPQEAFLLLKRMMEESLEPSPVTFMILVPACGEIGALSTGRELHGYILKSQFDEQSSLTSALVDMYGKCGSILEAKRVFDSEVHSDVASWNSMISSFSAHGMAEDAMILFDQMEASGIVPDDITFVALLSACARDGLLQEGWKFFNSMSNNYGLTPTLEHSTCMVAILGTAGLLNEALEFIRQMPYKPDACTWVTLLRACRTHSNPLIGEKAAKALYEHEPDNASNYILLSNIYASVGLWDSAKDVRKSMRGPHLMTIKECSFVYTNAKMYTFRGGEDSHLIPEDIMDTWEKLVGEMNLADFSPQDPVFGDVEELNPFSCLHTEKLAVCCGIISSSSSKPIRISKNIRMCIDCHMTVKCISKIIGREIYVKDTGFYHHIKDGICSCRDRW